MTSIESAAGTFGKPGMVMISPQIATTNSAPAESRTSRTGMLKPVGAPLASGIGRERILRLGDADRQLAEAHLFPGLELILHRFVGGGVVGAVNLLGDRAHLFEQRHLVGIKELQVRFALIDDLDHGARDVGRALAAHRPVIGHQRLDAERLALLLDQIDLGVGVGGEAVDRDHRRQIDIS